MRVSELQKRLTEFNVAGKRLQEEISRCFPKGAHVRNKHYKGVTGQVVSVSPFHPSMIEVYPWGNTHCMNIEIITIADPEYPVAGNA